MRQEGGGQGLTPQGCLSLAEKSQASVYLSALLYSGLQSWGTWYGRTEP